jgi:hypothetical protein
MPEVIVDLLILAALVAPLGGYLLGRYVESRHTEAVIAAAHRLMAELVANERPPK